LFNEKRTVKSHSSPFLSVQLHNVVTQRFLDDISTDGGVFGGGGYKSRTPAEETCAETPEKGMHTTRTSLPAVQPWVTLLWPKYKQGRHTAQQRTVEQLKLRMVNC